MIYFYDPVYPSQTESRARTGMTKREEFAKAAMIGILADPGDHADELNPGESCAQGVARLAVEQADALIEALNK